MMSFTVRIWRTAAAPKLSSHPKHSSIRTAASAKSRLRNPAEINSTSSFETSWRPWFLRTVLMTSIISLRFIFLCSLVGKHSTSAIFPDPYPPSKPNRRRRCFPTRMAMNVLIVLGCLRVRLAQFWDNSRRHRTKCNTSGDGSVHHSSEPDECFVGDRDLVHHRRLGTDPTFLTDVDTTADDCTGHH